MTRLPGACTAAVARLPSPIRRSPSPLSASTRRPGCAMARPRAMATVPPMAPHSGKFSGESPASVMSQAAEPSPPITSASPRSARIARTTARRRSGKVSLLSAIVATRPLALAEGLAADDTLRDQHRDRDAALESKTRRLLDRLADACRLIDRIDERTGEAQRLAGVLSHRYLPRVELAPLTAHRHEREQRETALCDQRQHVDAVADAAALHEEGAALPTEPGAGEERDAFLLGGEADGADDIVFAAEIDQPGVAGIRDIGDLPYVDRAKYPKNVVRPMYWFRHAAGSSRASPAAS